MPLALLRLDQLVLKRVLELALRGMGKRGKFYLDLPATGRSIESGTPANRKCYVPSLITIAQATLQPDHQKQTLRQRTLSLIGGETISDIRDHLVRLSELYVDDGALLRVLGRQV